MAGSYDAVVIEPYQGEPAAFGEPLTIPFKITNQSSSPLAKQTLKIHPCSLESYWEPSFVQVPELCAHSSKHVHLKAFCQQTANAEDIPAKLTVQLEPCGVQQTSRLRFKSFTGGLTKLSPAGLQGSLGVDKFNILLFGQAGAGKSSFINAVHTLLSSDGRDVVSTQAATGGTADHITVEYRKHEVAGAPFLIWDTWGLAGTGGGADPYDTVLPAALEGFLPSNFCMEDHQKLSHPAMRRDLEAGSATRPKRRIHCVLFFFPSAALGSEASYGTLRKAFQRVKRRGYNPLVLVTLLDLEDATIRQKPLPADLAIKHPKVEEALKEVSDKLGIPRYHVLHCVNYVDTSRRDFEIDRLTYKILDRALGFASDFCKVQRPLLTWDETFQFAGPSAASSRPSSADRVRRLFAQSKDKQN